MPPGLLVAVDDVGDVVLRLGALQAARLTDARNAAIPPAVCRKRRRFMHSASEASIALTSAARARSVSPATGAAGTNSPLDTGPTTTGNRRSSSSPGRTRTLWRARRPVG